MQIHKEIRTFIITLAILGTAITLTALILIIISDTSNVNANYDIENNTDSSKDNVPVIPEPPTLYFPEVETGGYFEITAPKADKLPTSYLIEDFEPILQLPELPTGCEVTSLTMLLVHLGFDIDKLTLADNFLTKADARTASFYDAFIGNPRSTSSFGCYAPVIVKCAVDYLRTQDTSLKIYNYTGSEFSAILEQVSKGYPCIIWSTISLLEPYMAENWVINGETCQWYAQEHCVVLIGYDLEKNEVTIADPLSGIRTRDLELFKLRYEQMFKQAIFIH